MVLIVAPIQQVLTVFYADGDKEVSRKEYDQLLVELPVKLIAK